MAKVVQKKKLSAEIPMAIADGVPNLKSISGRLKVLYTATQGGDCDYYEFSGFQNITQHTLEDSIEQLDGIIAGIEKCYGMNDN